MRRWWVRLIAAVAVIVVLLIGAAYLLTNSDWGREQIRSRLVALLQNNSHGLVQIGTVTGNLLKGFTAHDVVITDSAKAPFVKADEIWARYSLGTLRGKRIEFSEVRLVRPVVVIDKQPGPGGKWNFDRIFPRDTMTSTGPRKTGWGTWIRFSNATILDGDVTIRSPWEPDSRLTGAEREDAVRRALGPGGRLKILRVANGFQKESRFYRINALLPLVRLEDPAYKTRLADVAALRMIAEPFQPPVADVRALAGRFEFTGDSIWWRGAKTSLPNTRLSGDGRYLMTNGDLHLQLHGDPVRPGDLRWALPNLPEQGSGKLDFALHWVESKSIYEGRNMDVSLAGSKIQGGIEVTVTDTLAYRDANLRFSSLSTRLLQKLLPIQFPRHGLLAGRAEFNGGQHSLRVDADVTFDEERSGRSRVAAVGVLGLDKGVFNARDLRVRMLPLQMQLAWSSSAAFPLRGTLTGTATLNGSTATQMLAVGDVTHIDRGARSRAIGRATIRTRGVPWVDIDARMEPLALATVGRFVPSFGLRGTASGPVRLRGSLSNLAVNTDLTFPDGGFLGMRGSVDLASRVKGYDLDITTRLFDASAVIARAPPTSITAVASARGRGFDPATMQATLVADISASSYDTVSIDRANVKVAIANGIASFDTLAVEIPEGIIEARGSFGLAPGRSGSLTYHIAIDSLARVASLISRDTAVVPPRPGILARRVARARADSIRIAQQTEVERAVTGRVLPRTVVDTPAVVRMNELSGSVRADGVATGNIRNFSVKGTASGSSIVARGNTVGSFVGDYTWINARTPQSQVSVNTHAREVRALGFDLDSVSARLTYQKPNGTAEIVVNQDDARSYAANAQFTLDKLRNSLTLNNLRLQFDTSVWASTRVASVQWGQVGVEVNNLELRNGPTGRIYVNGLVPKEGSANLDIAVDNVNVADVIALTQSDINAHGLISFNVHATGTLADPRFKGSFGATELVYNGTLTPEVHGEVEYANQTLTGRAEAMRAGRQPFLIAEGSVPVNLALTGVTGSRFPTDREIALTINADSLPFDMMPQLNDVVSNVRGQASGNFRVAGTLNRPVLSGQFALHNGAARVVPVGINVTNIEASIRMLRDTVVIDSIAGRSRDGRFLITGGLGIGSLREPSFDLRLVANDALVLDNHRGELEVSTQIAMVGPSNDPHVTGSVRIRDGYLYIPPSDNKNLIGTDDPALFSVLDTAVMANRELFPSQNPLFSNLRMDVNLRVDRDVFVRSREANVEVYTDTDIGVHVNRAKESIVLDGVLLSERGEYRFLTRRFNIKRGSATFINSADLNPTLQVTGEYEVQQPNREAINIQILIGGTLRTPNISLTSNAQPPIPQSDLLSYLAFGQSSSSLVQLEGSGLTSGSGGDNVVGAGAALASKQLAGVALGVAADEVAGEAARSLGADVFTITPADVQTDVGNFLRGTQFEFGKYLRSHTFLAVQSPLDPAALKRPGIQLVHRFGGLQGYRLETGLETRYLLQEPTLARDRGIATTSVFGAFLVREWRF
ncbi:MAG: translocation/assembly module TamB domain-containing protein [Gemmatimonadaceae bacterium]